MALRKKTKTSLRHRRRSTMNQKLTVDFRELGWVPASELEIVKQELKVLKDNISSGIIKITDEDANGDIINATS